MSSEVGQQLPVIELLQEKAAVCLQTPSLAEHRRPTAEEQEDKVDNVRFTDFGNSQPYRLRRLARRARKARRYNITSSKKGHLPVLPSPPDWWRCWLEIAQPLQPGQGKRTDQLRYPDNEVKGDKGDNRGMVR